MDTGEPADTVTMASATIAAVAAANELRAKLPPCNQSQSSQQAHLLRQHIQTSCKASPICVAGVCLRSYALIQASSLGAQLLEVSQADCRLLPKRLQPALAFLRRASQVTPQLAATHGVWRLAQYTRGVFHRGSCQQQIPSSKARRVGVETMTVITTRRPFRFPAGLCHAHPP